MQDAVKVLKKHNLLKIINEPLDIDLEIPHIAYIEVKKSNPKALLFLNPISKKLNKKYSTPVLMNIFSSDEAVKAIFEKEPKNIAKEIEDLLKMKVESGFFGSAGMIGKLISLKNIPPKKLNRKGVCQELIKQNDEINLYDLPILKTWAEDGGPFVTMGQVYTQTLDGKLNNVGMYRLQVYDKNHLGVHWQIHKDASHFFHEYKQAGKKMPISVAIGGDPLYIWCGQAPMPYGFFELLLYGFIRGENAKLVKSLTNPIYIPNDSDFVIEGWIDPEKFEIEGPFGDHTGYYTPKEPYPVMEVTCISSKINPVYHATVVGKPPLEDKYMGRATGEIFLPLLKTTAPALIDYCMPENGVFHNLIIAKMETRYKGHAQQFMHAFWGVGQMSFVKHAFFVNSDAPSLTNYEQISRYILNKITKESLLISEGVCDALDHSSSEQNYGGKLGVDCTKEEIYIATKNIISDEELLFKMQELAPEIKDICQFCTDTKTPITVISVEKIRVIKDVYEALKAIFEHTKLLVFVDDISNDIRNKYMIIWRVTNNIDAKRDIFIDDEFFGIDGTNKSVIDGYTREWPNDVDCDKEVIKELRKRNLIDVDDEFLKRFWI